MIAMNSTPSTSASTMRLTALTPAPPTPTTRRTGAAGERARRRTGAARRSARRARGPGRRAAGRSMMFSGMSAENAWRRRSCGDGIGAATAPGSGCGAALGRRRARASAAVRSSVLRRLVGLAEQGRQGALAHARSLTACHGREPPSRDRDRPGRPCPSGSYLSTDIPFTGASAKRTVLRMREANTRSPKFSSRISIASLAWIVRESTSVGRMPSISTSGFRFSRIIAACSGAG